MKLADFIRQMPKVELHVHLEGAIQPATLLKLARHNNIALPADNLDGLRRWYTFTDFAHFVTIYKTISECIRTPEDIELVAREFLQGQADQNIRYSEVTYTPYTHYQRKGLSFDVQLEALNRARTWAKQTLGVDAGWVIDIARSTNPEEGDIVAEWALSGRDSGVIAFGIGGSEIGNPPEKFATAFARVIEAGLPCVPHAGEIVGPVSIWSALNVTKPVRLYHGVRSIEDPALVELLRDQQIPLDLCPTSNICLGVYPTLQDHPLPKLIDAGLYVTINSDDPPMFNTTLTNEYLAISETFGFTAAQIEELVMKAVRVTLLPAAEKAALERSFTAEFDSLRAQLA
jgi:adenosine deaminase